MTERSSKGIIKGMREVVKPFIGDFLKHVNYDGMGDMDKAEFEKEFEKVLTLAEKAETLSEILDKISAEIRERIADCEHGEEIVGDDFGIFAISIQTYSNVLKIIEKYKGVSE